MISEPAKDFMLVTVMRKNQGIGIEQNEQYCIIAQRLEKGE